MPTISDSQIISLHRGDSLRYPIFVNIGTKVEPMRYPLQDGDTLYVGVMEPNAPFECAVIGRALTRGDLNAEGDAVLSLSPEDTERMLPGLYYYEAKLECVREGGRQVFTVVPRRKLFVLE